jgi:RNA polymerase sigma-70 factor (ECF subfamily)
MLVERHRERAWRLALRILRNEEAAKDAVQEAFVKAYTALDRFEGRSQFSTWLHRLVVNQCIDMRRKEHFDRRVDVEDANALERLAAGGDDAPETPEPAVLRGELREQLTEAISELPDDARQTLLLREVDGLSYAEIAKSLGVPKGTVMSRLHYARRRVRERLIAMGVRAETAEREGP